MLHRGVYITKFIAILVVSIGLCNGLTYNPVADPKAQVTFGLARFTVLTPRLVRMELGGGGTKPTFDDRPSITVVNRRLPVPTFSVSNPNSTTVVITTSQLKITHMANYVRDTCVGPQSGKDQTNGQRVPNYPNGLAAGSQAACCAACNKDNLCTAWVFAVNQGGIDCWLMMNVQGTTNASNRVFGGSTGGSGFTSSNLKIEFTVGGRNVIWAPGTANSGNLGGSISALDCYSTKEQCYNQYLANLGVGLASTDGWTLLDDTATARYDGVIDAIMTDVPWYTNTMIDKTDYYFFSHGSNLDYRGTISDYAQIGGLPALPPRSSFGIWWSRYYSYSETQFINEVLSGYVSNNLPISHVVLDMDWHIEPNSPGCQSWGGYTFNTQLWPDPPKFLASLHDSSSVLGHPVKIGLNVHPQTGVDHCQANYPKFARDMGVDPSSQKTVPCEFGNVTFAKYLFNDFLDVTPLDTIDFWWTDYGGCTGPNGRELYWSNYVFDAHKIVNERKRPLVLSRYGGLGNHRYPIGFSGDTFQAFLTLQYLVEMTPMAANVLFGYWSHDIGGFHSGNGSPGDGNPANKTGSEMYLRWIQFGAVSPILRTHCDHCERRIWVFPHFEWMKHGFYLRNALVPYIYSSARMGYDTGIAIVHPMYYDNPNDKEAYDYAKTQYMFGDYIVASPITTPLVNDEGTVSQTVWLPAGTWSNWNGTQVYKGPTTVKLDYGVQDIPLFVKSRAVIPLQKETAVVTPFANPLVWCIFPGETQGGGTVYEDDGDNLQYINGEYTTTSISFSRDSNSMKIAIEPTSGTVTNMPSSRSQGLQIRGVSKSNPAGPKSVVCNGKEIPKGNGQVGWYITTDYGLAIVQGSLVISLGEFSLKENISVVVQF